MTENIQIKTEIPGTISREIASDRETYIADALGSESLLPSYIESGRGAIVEDVDGNSFIDFTGGWGCLIVGHTPKRVVDALKDQTERFLHTDFSAVPYDSYIKLAKKLAELAPGEEPNKVAFFNSGAEAVENAVKIARGYTGRKAVVVFEGAFHGRTLLTMSMTHQANPYKYKFGPFAPDVYRLPYFDQYRGSADITCQKDWESQLKTLVNPEEVAAIVIEPIQGEGGFRLPEEGFLAKIREVSEKYGIMFVVDEIQSGMGRTGKFFAIENWSIDPDLITLGKSLAAGLPLSAVLGSRKVFDSLPEGSLGGTYCGNPLACRAGIEVVNIIKEKELLTRAIKIGDTITSHLNRFKESCGIVGDVRGIGAMIGLEFVKSPNGKEPNPEVASEVVSKCVEKGLLVPSCGLHKNVIRLLLPLVITDEQLIEGLEILERAIDEVAHAES